jgi:hypothetical protein
MDKKHKAPTSNAERGTNISAKKHNLLILECTSKEKLQSCKRRGAIPIHIRSSKLDDSHCPLSIDKGTQRKTQTINCFSLFTPGDASCTEQTTTIP